MKKTIATLILSAVCIVSVSGQVCDTLKLYNCDVIMELKGFKLFREQADEHGTYAWTYVYLRQYEQPQKYSASYIWIYFGDPLCSYMHSNINYETYFQAQNRYGGMTEKSRSDDGLYFRWDTYKEYFNEKVSVMYFYVREEDLELFERILDDIRISPMEREGIP